MLSITGKITKDIRTFQASEYTGFSFILGKQYYDRQTKAKVWSNYKVCVFAKDKQAEFYNQTLVIGTIVSVYADDVKIDMYNPEYPSIELVDAKMSGVFTQNSGVQNNNNVPQANQQSAQAPQQQQNNNQQQQANELDSDIPF